MNRIVKALLSAALCLCLACSFGIPALAEERTVKISTAEEFLEFAENCRLDTYSEGLTAELTADIDLAGFEFDGIPTFSGVFNGNGHTVSGVLIEGEGSVQGFFRYVRQGAEINDLTVCGAVAPEGSRSTVGGIAGSNGGRVYNCSFEGAVVGADYVGGIAGVNELTGIIEGCQVHGSIVGNHFVGGAAGENVGVIRNTKNDAEINTTAAQNEVELSDITLETLTGTEAVDTVTDVGGIAGSSSGVIRNCANYGNVGYQLMGYNIGGIAGSQCGYITGCINHGQIYGRKEVGGIVGQMEPVTAIEYTEDTLQILQGQVGTLEALVSRTAANARSNASEVTGQVGVLEGQVQDARDAVDVLTPGLEDIPDLDVDTILAAQSTLTNSITSMPGTIKGIADSSRDTVTGLTRDLNAVSSQIGVISGTVSQASENLGASITDVSDDDTEEDLLGKVENCTNYGAVLGDINIGGVVGAISYVNDLDTQEDIDVYGDTSLNVSGEIRAVVLNCSNSGSVTVNKQSGGGIVGLQTLGLVKGCLNTGSVKGAKADYVGGVVGASGGFLRQSDAKCEVAGESYVGGIAGVGSVVTDCRGMTVVSGTENCGAVLGDAEEKPDKAAEDPDIYGNYYLAVGGDIGAIDGISYEMCAQSLERSDFLAMDGLNAAFCTVTIQFVFEDGTRQYVQLYPGSPLESNMIPEIPEKDGFESRWDGLEDINTDSVNFDAVVYAVYTQKRSVIESTEVTDDGLCLLLVQGEFDDDSVLTLDEYGEVTPNENQELLASGKYTVSGGRVTALRCYVGADYKDAELRVVVTDEDGERYEAEYTVDGSYVVFETDSESGSFAVVVQENNLKRLVILGGGALVAVVVICIIISSAVKAGRRKKALKAAGEIAKTVTKDPDIKKKLSGKDVSEEELETFLRVAGKLTDSEE